jgi:CheY-like chemotaxis protein
MPFSAFPGYGRQYSSTFMPPAANYLPAFELAVMKEASRPAPAVLVVEDDPMIRIDAVMLVEEAGFRVYEAADADEAISLLEQRQDIRLIFTDVKMPGSMDGLKLAHYVRGRWPPVKIIVTSGQFRPKDGDLPLGGIFLSKPYRAEQVAQHLRQLIG